MINLKDVGFPDYAVTADGCIYSLKSRRFLNTQFNDNGYVVVTLRLDGKTKTIRVHRLVAMMYLKDSYFENAHVNHKDGCKTNNHFSNLEWVTRSENMQHAYKNNLVISKCRVLSDDDVHTICSMLEGGSRVPDVAKMFGIDKNIVYRITMGTSFKDISQEYDFSKVPKQQKLSPEKVKKICEMLEKCYPVDKISTDLLVNESSVKAIKYRRVHLHISSSFVW